MFNMRNAGRRAASPFSVASLPRSSLGFQGAGRVFPVAQKDVQEIELFLKRFASIPKSHELVIPRQSVTGGFVPFQTRVDSVRLRRRKKAARRATVSAKK